MTKKKASTGKQGDSTSKQVPYDGTERRRDEDKERRGDVMERRVGLHRRRGPGRRRSDERRAAEEGEMTDEQFEFLMAIDRYKSLNNRPFPTWTEVLEVIHAIGYRKVAEPKDIR